MNDPRVEAAATALLEMFAPKSSKAVSFTPLTLATAAITAADKVDPLRMYQVPQWRGLPNNERTAK